MSFLATSIYQFQHYKELAEKAMLQISDTDFLKKTDDTNNSLVVLIKHLHGNMLSRFTNFLAEDGEKVWRQRDNEFEYEVLDRKSVMMLWEEGWACVLDNIRSLKKEDLRRTIFIRSEPMEAGDAILRQLMHYAYHVGQIIWYCKGIAGENWKTLSIPKGESKAYNDEMKEAKRE